MSAGRASCPGGTDGSAVSLWPPHVKPAACAGCPHERLGRGFVPGAGDIETAEVVEVFERPGEEEVAIGEPLVGRTGKVVERASGGWRGVYRTNVRKCLSDDEDKDRVEAAIAHCSGAYLMREMTLAAKATRLLLGGDEAARAFGHPGEATKWNGAVLTAQEFAAMVAAQRTEPA